MADKITADLLAKVKASFDEKCKNHYLIQSVEKKVIGGTADLIDVQSYAGSLGTQLANAFLECIDFTSMPDGRLYYDLAKNLLGETLKTNYELINAAAATVQRTLDDKVGCKLKAQKAKFPDERVDKIAKSVCDPTVSQETIERRLTSPIENISESFYTDYVKENAKFRSNAGMKCYITRISSGKCCNWCDNLAGRYEYGEEPDDVYRRHDNCDCSVTYESNRTRQDVWSKKSWEAPETDKSEYKPEVLDYEQAKAVEAQNMRFKGVDKSGESGIIESRNISVRNLPNGLRTSPSHILSNDEISDLQNDIKSIDADETVFKFNSGMRTGYDDVLDEIRVKGDILPDSSSNHPRDRMSSRAALAHEYYGHRANRGTKLPKGAWNDEFRASYMAAKNCPNLSDTEKRDLILDALERAKESGVTIKYNDFIRRVLYGY